ncbi:E3 ubiquitin-protein ligase TRIM39-like [Scomber japonicus]|uniref:E3 ubiquitin-protein ligase TRIM39-like n=1 Tax=Scomber japonicus TaxID=13676 RepID=UPI0023066EAA|nr:E3 ubiquitin-protein ligase TRIM39-like [Scomber japonicus]
MLAASSVISEDQFLCSICLDVFTHPVTIPCGHNLCKNCITQHWNINTQCQCPMCKKVFNTRPELHINTIICEMAAQFRRSAVMKSSNCSEQQQAKTEEVLCDVCTATKLKAVKSCLMCLTSYCETHLEVHQNITGMTRHKLIDPVKNLKDRMCKKHDRPLELFCKTDKMCVCLSCAETDHKLHHSVTLIEECEGRKAELVKKKTEVPQLIQERQLKIEQIKQSVKLSKEEADRETAASVQVFNDLIKSVERSLTELVELTEEKHKTVEKQAEGFIKELEEEISALVKRGAEVEHLLLTEDHLQLLQNFPSLNPTPPTKYWTGVRVHSSFKETVRRVVNHLEKTLSISMKNMCAALELKKIQQYAVDVTLDPDTAHPNLILSDDRKQVSHGDVKQNLPDNPERCFPGLAVLGKQSFSSGKFYYEVQVKDKTDWTLGVVRGSINRKRIIDPRPANGVWTISLRNGCDYKAFDNILVPLSLKLKPRKVGVFVDYEEGLVSFYNVDAAALIYSFTGCKLMEELCLIFGPRTNDGGKNSAPLIISPVNHTD